MSNNNKKPKNDDSWDTDPPPFGENTPPSVKTSTTTRTHTHTQSLGLKNASHNELFSPTTLNHNHSTSTNTDTSTRNNNSIRDFRVGGIDRIPMLHKPGGSYDASSVQLKTKIQPGLSLSTNQSAIASSSNFFKQNSRSSGPVSNPSASEDRSFRSYSDPVVDKITALPGRTTRGQSNTDSLAKDYSRATRGQSNTDSLALVAKAYSNTNPKVLRRSNMLQLEAKSRDSKCEEGKLSIPLESDEQKPQTRYRQSRTSEASEGKKFVSPQRNAAPSKIPVSNKKQPKKQTLEVIDMVDSDDEMEQTLKLAEPERLEKLFTMKFEKVFTNNDPTPSSRLDNDISRVIDIEKVCFGSLWFTSESVVTRILGVRFIGGLYQELIISIIDLKGEVTFERIKFDHIKQISLWKEEKSNDDVIIVIVPKATLTLCYLTCGPASFSPVINPNARKCINRNILIVIKKEFEMEVRKCLQHSLPKEVMVDMTHIGNEDEILSSYRYPYDASQRDALLAQLAASMDSTAEITEKTRRRRSSLQNNLLVNTRDPNDSKVFCIFPPELETMDAITVHNADIKRLLPGVYFNDCLIDLKIKHMLSDMGNISVEKRGKIYALSCLFYTKYSEGTNGSDSHLLVSRWTKNVDIFAQDFILFPINLHNHWSLAVVVRPNLLEALEKIKLEDGEDAVDTHTDNLPCFLHLDSLSMHNTDQIFKKIANYLWHEREALKVRKSPEIVTDSAECKQEEPLLPMETKSEVEVEVEVGSTEVASLNKEPPQPEKASAKSSNESSAVQIKRLEKCLRKVKCKVPMQENGYDCGVFVTRFAQMVLDKWPTSTIADIKDHFQSHFKKEFSQADIDLERDSIKNLLDDLRGKYLSHRKDIQEDENVSSTQVEIVQDTSLPVEILQDTSLPDKVTTDFSFSSLVSQVVMVDSIPPSHQEHENIFEEHRYSGYSEQPEDNLMMETLTSTRSRSKSSRLPNASDNLVESQDSVQTTAQQHDSLQHNDVDSKSIKKSKKRKIDNDDDDDAPSEMIKPSNESPQRHNAEILKVTMDLVSTEEQEQECINIPNLEAAPPIENPTEDPKTSIAKCFQTDEE